MSDLFRAMFPYGMERNPDGSWTFFNRRYKPVGVMTRDWADWDDPKHKMRLKGLGPATLAKLGHKWEGSADRVYFYDDASNPTRSVANRNRYFEKLAILFGLEEDSR